MNNENIEEILKIIGDEDVPAEIHALTKKKFEDFNKTLKPSRQHILWSNIMKNRIAKLAVAAVIVTALIVWSIMPISVLPTAYALQDTIKAYSSIRWLHIKESEPISQEETRTSDIWLECNEQGNVTRMRFQSDNVGHPIGSLTVTGNSNNSEAWLAQHNLRLVGCSNPSVFLKYDVSGLDPKVLFERLFEQESRDEVIVDINEPMEKREPIIVTVTYPKGSRSENWKKVFYIDQATKLVTKIDKFARMNREQEFQYIKTFEFLDYNQQIDQRMFSLDSEVPADAKVVDMAKVEAGLPQGSMTDEEIAAKVTLEFYEAIIAKDFCKAGQLFLKGPDFLVKQAFIGINVLKIISVGPTHPDSDPDSNPDSNEMISSCKVLAEIDGQYYEVYSSMVRVIRIDKDTKHWIICGSATNIYPASGVVTLSRDGADLSKVTYHGLKPGEFMRKWLVLGPLHYPVRSGIYFASMEGQKVAFDTDSLDFINFTPKVNIDNTDYEWAVMESEYGLEDLTKLSDEKKHDFQIAYVWAQIEMPEARKGTLGIGSDDGVKVWLNGELVHENWLYRRIQSDNDRVPITFRKGRNQLVLKIQNALGLWGFCCRLLDE